MMRRRCLACGVHVSAALYLCPPCWRCLPAGTRDALNRRDARAAARLIELARALDVPTPLDEIVIT